MPRAITLFTGLAVAFTSGLFAQDYDTILKGGHVIDPKNQISAVRDVAIKDGKIAAVAANIAASQGRQIINVPNLYVVPGLVDIHVHVYAGTGEKNSYAGDNSVYPDGFTFRSGVTTVVDAGSSGWRSFEDFQDRIISRARTRVLAELNIVGAGMRGPNFENNLNDMDGKATGEMALKHKGVVVGIKSAHFAGPEWKPYEQAVIAGNMADVPVMIDYGANRPERPLYDLLTKVLRPGDIYTHMYSGARGEQDPETKGPAKGLIEGRKRGVIFDVGHGSGSFRWSLAVPMVKAGFIPDSISTDLHISSMNTGMKDMTNVMSKMLALGMSLDDVILRSTWNPAKEIKQEQYGNLSVGSVADVAVLRLDHGHYGFVDAGGGRQSGTQLLVCELTLKDGVSQWDLNGISKVDWQKLPPPGQGKKGGKKKQ
jgi:dihydroorotase